MTNLTITTENFNSTTMKKRIYISGKIGNPNDPDVRPKFNCAAQQLAAAGYEPVNPLDNGLPDNAPWIDHIIADLRTMQTCDGVYLLHDWTESDGARIECLFADVLFSSTQIIEQPARLAFQR